MSLPDPPSESYADAERVRVLALRLDEIEVTWASLVQPARLEERGVLNQLADLLSGLEHPRWVEVAGLAWSEHPSAWNDEDGWSLWRAAWAAEIARRREESPTSG